MYTVYLLPKIDSYERILEYGSEIQFVYLQKSHAKLSE